MELRTELLPWQAQAVDKLLHIRIGALYMEMGTGKTRTALEIIKRRMDAGKLDRVLWLCPCSVQATIQRDIDKHAIGADMILIRGIESLSGSTRLYGELMRYVSDGVTMLVVDESNLVKNHHAIRTLRVTNVAEQCKYRMILNGTPISKNEKDLFSQWYLLDWRVLGYQSFWSFAANHLEYDEERRGRIRRVLHVDYLTDKIAPYSFLVKKADCMQLPSKMCYAYGFSLGTEQRAHYIAMRDAFLDTLITDDSPSAIYRVFTALQDIASGRRIVSSAHKPIEHVPMFADPEENPRIAFLHSILSELDGEKVVIWCKYEHEIRDISQSLRNHYGKQSVTEFYGEMPLRKRNESLSRFAGDATFFIANKACAGYGLNLQFCHFAIYYNNDWDWATRAQSEDRLHRIGQESDVVIYDVYAKETIDERILSCLARKESLVDGFKESIKSKNTDWIDGSEKRNDPYWTEQSAKERPRERVRQQPRDQSRGRVLAASLSDDV